MNPLRNVRVRTAPILVSIAGDFGRLMNISATGALVHVRQTLVRGSEPPVRECLPRRNTSLTGPMVIHVKPDPVELSVQVVRSTAVGFVQLPEATIMKSEECEVALLFTDLSPKAQSAVKRLCGLAFEKQE